MAQSHQMTQRLLPYTSYQKLGQELSPQVIKTEDRLCKGFPEPISGTPRQSEREGSGSNLRRSSMKVHMSPIIILVLSWILDPSECCDAQDLELLEREIWSVKGEAVPCSKLSTKDVLPFSFWWTSCCRQLYFSSREAMTSLNLLYLFR
jgi:hypothetical protein